MATPSVKGCTGWGAPSALSIGALAGMFSPVMIRAFQLALAIPAFFVLAWATGLLGDVVAGWMPSIVGTLGPWGYLGCLVAFFVVLYATQRALVRREEVRRYATTGVIEVERPHPWPVWLRVLAFAPLALGMVAVIVAAANGQ